jgi:hypothetical protein
MVGCFAFQFEFLNFDPSAIGTVSKSSHDLTIFFVLVLYFKKWGVCRCARRNLRTTVLLGKVKLMKIAEAVPVPHGGISRTHDGESLPGIFNVRGIVLETGAVPADRPGTSPLNGIINFHALMRYDGCPVMTEHEYGQDVSQNYVYNHSGGECDKRFDSGIRQFTESGGKTDA